MPADKLTLASQLSHAVVDIAFQTPEEPYMRQWRLFQILRARGLDETLLNGITHDDLYGLYTAACSLVRAIRSQESC